MTELGFICAVAWEWGKPSLRPRGLTAICWDHC